MSRFSTFILTCAVGTLALMPDAMAENGPIIRDCSFAATPGGSVDADFVLVSGQTLKVKNGVLTALTSQNLVNLTASESMDTGDSAGKVTLQASVSSPGQPTLSFTGSGTGFTILGIPLNGSSVGRVYTISWAATFDGGQHMCPSQITPSNTAPNPFMITVVKSN